MKTLTAALLATAFAASPALACSYGKTASFEKPEHTASMPKEKSHEAMSTFDPEQKPRFEVVTEATDEPVTEEIAE